MHIFKLSFEKNISKVLKKLEYKVSVVIPTYKRSVFLERAISSVLNQTYQNIEIIVVDDNPPDSVYRSQTEDFMNQYVSEKKVTYIKNSRSLGGALARNEGIAIAKGEYVTFLDDDDIYLPDKIYNQVIYMIDHNIDFSFTDVRIHNQSEKLIDYREHTYVKSLSNEELLKKHIMHHLTPTGTYMFKKDVLVSLGGFEDVKMGQEFMLMLKAIRNNVNIGYFPEANIIQYIHDEERISVGSNKLNKEVELYLYKRNYFKHLNYREKQYVKYRHHAVMAIVGKRSGKYRLAFKHLIKAIVSAPTAGIKDFIAHKKKIKKYQNITQ